MKISKIHEYSDKEIINMIITLIGDHIMFITNWGEFIFGKELNLPNEHKNKIFCIWFCGAMDSMIDFEDQYTPLLEQAKKRKLS